MKLGITLTVVGLAGTLLFFAAAADVGNWGLYAANPWFLVAGAAFFIVFLIGYYRFRKAVKKKRADRGLL
jgi:Na+-transporting NADH:ubiquinone oxidoreductase subunit NqrD